MIRMQEKLLPYFEPPHRTAKMVGEAIAWVVVLSVIMIIVVSYNVQHY